MDRNKLIEGDKFKIRKSLVTTIVSWLICIIMVVISAKKVEFITDLTSGIFLLLFIVGLVSATVYAGVFD